MNSSFGKPSKSQIGIFSIWRTRRVRLHRPVYTWAEGCLLGVILVVGIGCTSIKDSHSKDQVIEKSRWDPPPWTEFTTTSSFALSPLSFSQGDGVPDESLAYVHRFEDRDLLEIDPRRLKACQKPPCRSTRLDRLIEVSKDLTVQKIHDSLVHNLKAQAIQPQHLKRLAPMLWDTCKKWSAPKVQIADLYYERRQTQDASQKYTTVYTLWVLTKFPQTTPHEILAQIAPLLHRTNDPAANFVTKALEALDSTRVTH